MANAASGKPGAGVVEDLAEVGQKPHAAAAADAHADDLGGGGGFAKTRGGHQDRGTVASGIGLAQIGDGLNLAGAELDGHASVADVIGVEPRRAPVAVRRDAKRSTTPRGAGK